MKIPCVNLCVDLCEKRSKMYQNQKKLIKIKQTKTPFNEGVSLF